MARLWNLPSLRLHELVPVSITKKLQEIFATANVPTGSSSSSGVCVSKAGVLAWVPYSEVLARLWDS